MGQQINELGAMDEVALSAWYAAHNFESQSDAVYRVAAEIEDAKTLAEAEAIKASYAPYFLFNEIPMMRRVSIPIFATKIRITPMSATSTAMS